MAKTQSNRTVSIEDAESAADTRMGEPSGNKNKLKVVYGSPVFVKITSLDMVLEKAHYIKGEYYRCVGDNEESKGFDPQHCPACKTSMNAFKKAKTIVDENQKKYWTNIGKDLQSKLHCALKVVVGEGNLTKVKNKKTGKIETIVGEVLFADDAKEKILELSEVAYHRMFKNREAKGNAKAVTRLVDEFPFIGVNKNLVNFPLMLERKEEGKIIPLTITAINQKVDFTVAEENQLDLSEEYSSEDLEAMRSAIELYMNSSDTDEAPTLDDEEKHRVPAKAKVSAPEESDFEVLPPGSDDEDSI